MTKKKVKASVKEVKAPIRDKKAEAERAEARKSKKAWMEYVAKGGA